MVKPPLQNVGSKSTEVEMGKVNAWVLDMEEDAIDMTVEEWTARRERD